MGKGKGTSSSLTFFSPQLGEGASVASAFDTIAVARGRANKGEDDEGVVITDLPAVGGGGCGTTSTFKTAMATTTMAAKGKGVTREEEWENKGKEEKGEE